MMAEKTAVPASKLWASAEYQECKDLFKAIVDEGYSVARIVKEAGVSLELARRCAADLNIPIKSAATQSSATSTSNPASSSTPGASPSSASTSAPAVRTNVAAKLPPILTAAPATAVAGSALSPVATSATTPTPAYAPLKQQPPPETKWTCPYGCGKSYQQRGGLDYHVQKGKCDARDGRMVASDLKTFRCRVPGCTRIFETGAGLTHHYTTNHGALGQELAKASTAA